MNKRTTVKHVHYHVGRRYGIVNFAIDTLLVCCTGGLWLVWIFCREMRKR